MESDVNKQIKQEDDFEEVDNIKDDFTKPEDDEDDKMIDTDANVDKNIKQEEKFDFVNIKKEETEEDVRNEQQIMENFIGFPVKTELQDVADGDGDEKEGVDIMEFSKSQRGGLVLLFRGFEYLKIRENNKTGVTIWRCREFHTRKNNCHAFIKTRGKNIVGKPASHSHDSCPLKAKANIAMSRMKESMKVVGASAGVVKKNVLTNLSSEVLFHFPKPSSLTRMLLRHKSEVSKPDDTPNFTIPEKFSHLILYDSGEDDPDRILALGDMQLLQELDKDIIFGDGTFDKAPSLNYELYTWHANIGCSYPPCVYFLLQRKNLETYNKMLHVLMLMLPNLSPYTVCLDLEKDCISAAHTAFPYAEVKSCYFHLCQNLIKKVHSVGLKSEYEGNIEIKLMLKSLAALAFVPSNEVKDVFESLAATFPDGEMFNDILTYFSTTFIQGAVGRDPQFPISTWNHFEAASTSEISPRTTNCCEGFHNTLNSNFHCSQLSLTYLLDRLQKDVSYHRETLTKTQMGLPKVKRKKFEQVYYLVGQVVQGYQAEENKLSYLRKLVSLH